MPSTNGKGYGMRIVAVRLTARRVQHTQHRGGARGAEGSRGGEWLRTAGKPKRARTGSTRVSPCSAGASSTQSAQSSRGRLTDALAGAGFARSSEQPAQLPSLQGCFFATPSLRFPMHAGGTELTGFSSRRGVASESNPLLKVPPAGRGNRTCAPSRSGETSAPSRFPSRSGETSAPSRFPSRSGGNLKEGGNPFSPAAHDSP